jgi:hypothetical protein
LELIVAGESKINKHIQYTFCMAVKLVLPVEGRKHTTEDFFFKQRGAM